MRCTRTLALLVFAFGLGCKGSSTGSNPQVTYTLQTKTSPPATANVGSAVTVAVTVLGNNVAASGQTVTFAVTSGGGTVAGAASTTVTSGGDGSATVSWTLGTTAATQTLHASISSTVGTDFTVTALALPASQLAIATPPSASVTAGVAFPQQPAIQLLDANRSGVLQAGVVITAAIASGSGTLGGTTTATTNANGLATFTNLSLSAAGTVTLNFTTTLSGQTAGVLSTAIAVTQPNQLAVMTAASITAQTGVPLFIQPVIQLKDGQGNVLHQAGVAVTASAATGSTGTLGVIVGGVGALTVMTDANGLATFHDLTLTGAGTSTLQFASPGITTATSALVTVSATTPTTIANATSAGPVAGAANTQTYYAFTVPAGTTSITFSTYGATGSVELYARPGAYPTTSDFSCHSNVAGAAQVCSITSNLTGTWYLAVNAVSAYVGSNVVAYAYNAACTPKTLTLGVAVNGSVTSTSCGVEIGSSLSEDTYSLTIATPQLVTFTNTGSGTNQLLIYRQGTVRGGFEGTATPFGFSNVYLLGAGTYTVSITDLQGGTPVTPLTYTLIATATPLEPTACKVLVDGGASATFNLTLRNTDCAGITPGTFSHRINVLLGAGQTLTATMASSAFDPFLRIANPFTLLTTGTTIIASNDNGGGGTTALVSYTNPSTLGDAVSLLVEATSAAPGGVGAYTLTLTLTPDFPDVQASQTFILRKTGTPPKQPN